MESYDPDLLREQISPVKPAEQVHIGKRSSDSHWAELSTVTHLNKSSYGFLRECGELVYNRPSVSNVLSTPAIESILLVSKCKTDRSLELYGGRGYGVVLCTGGLKVTGSSTRPI